MPASDKKLDRLVADLGEAVRERRQGKNISQEALAEIADFDRTYISLLERGARNPAGMVVASVCPNASGVNAVSVESEG